jgi:hypothetical protein
MAPPRTLISQWSAARELRWALAFALSTATAQAQPDPAPALTNVPPPPSPTPSDALRSPPPVVTDAQPSNVDREPGSAGEPAAGGPPAAALEAPVSEPTPMEAPPSPGATASGGFVDKSGRPYVDFVGAWGWEQNSYLATFSIFNMYLHDEGELLGFHGRLLAVGAVSFERTVVQIDQPLTTDRQTAFVLELIDPRLRLHFVEPVFVSLGVNLGMAFYQGLVPTLDGQVGVGFVTHGWGLELGLRSSRLPRAVTTIGDNEFTNIRYRPQLYFSLETNIGL